MGCDNTDEIADLRAKWNQPDAGTHSMCSLLHRSPPLAELKQLQWQLLGAEELENRETVAQVCKASTGQEDELDFL